MERMTEYHTRYIGVQADTANNVAVLTFIPQGQSSVSVYLPLESLPELIAQASAELLRVQQV
jgi:hypothetical protein